MALQALEQAMQCGAVPGTQNPLEDLSVPRAVSHAMQPETNKWSGILFWSYLCMCVKKEQSDFLPEPPEKTKQLTSKLH